MTAMDRTAGAFALRAAALCCAVFAVTVAQAGEFAHPEAPRLVNFHLRSDVEDIVGREAFLAQWDLLILPYHVLDRLPESLALIRELNPEQITIAAMDNVLIPDDISDDTSQLMIDLVSGVREEWIAMSTLGEPIVFWPGTIHVNLTEACPVVEGERYRDYFTRFVRERIFPYIVEDRIDGVLLDEMSSGSYLWWDPLFPGTFDYDNDGLPDAGETVEAWLRDSMSFYADSLAATLPAGGVLMGNNCKPRYPALNGKLYESFPARWEGYLVGSLHDLDVWNSLTAGTNVTSVNGMHAAVPTNLRQFRYRFGASLLTDSYFSFDHSTEDHHQEEWFELFDTPLGRPLGLRYTLNETPTALYDFEDGDMSGVAAGPGGEIALTQRRDEVIEGDVSLRVRATTDNPWPLLLRIDNPLGWWWFTFHTVSFRYRVLETDAVEDYLFFRAVTDNSSYQSPEAKINEGASGLYRATFAMSDPQDEYFDLYLESRGRVTISVDSLSIVPWLGGLWARDYERGTVVVNDSGMNQPLAYNPAWTLADADGQRTAYPGWQSGQDIEVVWPDGLVFTHDVLTAAPPGMALEGEEQLAAPARPALALGAPWPNPGRANFAVRLAGAAAGPVALRLYDVSGRRVADLWEGALPDQGRTLAFREGDGRLPALPSGVYLVRAEDGARTVTRRWVLMK